MKDKFMKNGVFSLEYDKETLKDMVLKLQEEKERLKDNWVKLKEYLHNVDVVIDYSENYDGSFINYDELINKMKELEESDSNENN